MNLTTRKIVAAGMLGALAIILAVSQLGFIPMPTGVHATIMHVPVIIGGIWLGPLPGALVGLIFGVYAMLNPIPAYFADPLISVFPRLLIGVVSYWVYRAWPYSSGRTMAAALAGSATNTIGVLGMIWLRGYLPFKAVGVVALANGIPEMIVAGAIVTVVIRVLRRVMPKASA